MPCRVALSATRNAYPIVIHRASGVVCSFVGRSITFTQERVRGGGFHPSSEYGGSRVIMPVSRVSAAVRGFAGGHKVEDVEKHSRAY